MSDTNTSVTGTATDGAWAPSVLTPEGAGVPTGLEGVDACLPPRDGLTELLAGERAIVLRGFGITEETLPAAIDRLLPNRLAYLHGNTPRTKVGDNIYTSTEYPADQTISMHNELSYARDWPSRLLFFCATPARTGGATSVVDGATWHERLDPEVRDAFSGGLRYIQNLHDGYGLGKSWQDTFETDDRDRVGELLAEADAEFEWKDDGGLRITRHRQATHRHPITGAEVWFNQSDQWHPAALGDEMAAELAAIMPPDELPQAVTFADGSPIPAEYVLQVRDRGLDAAVDVDWARGDLLVVDNVLVGHGRRPFTGERRVLVAMSEE